MNVHSNPSLTTNQVGDLERVTELPELRFPTHLAELLRGLEHKQGKCLALCVPTAQAQYTGVIT